MKRRYKFLGDIVIVEPLDSNITSSILHIPEVHRTRVAARRAKVLFVGKLTDFIKKKRIKQRMLINNTKKRDTYFPGEELQIGDVVWVREELGTRSVLAEYPNARIYDGEDVLAKELSDFEMQMGESFQQNIV